MDSISADKVLKKTPLDLQKRFPIYHACPKYLAAHCCGVAFPQNGLAFRQYLDEVGKTLVDWPRGIFHCVLIQHLENLSLSRSIHAIDSTLGPPYLACEFKDSISIFDQFSPRNCVEG